MCGRFYIAADDDSEELQAIIDEVNRKRPADAQLNVSGEIFPGNTVPVVANNRSGARSAFAMRWGYRLPGAGSRLVINARSETAATNRLFGEGYRSHRCLVPATSYFEWERRGAQRVKYSIARRSGELIYFAGVYRIEDNVPVFSILTREPADNIRFIHDRMPVILPREAVNPWLDVHTADPTPALRMVDTDVVFAPVV